MRPESFRSGNRASPQGGGLYANAGSLTLTNTTVTGNCSTNAGNCSTVTPNFSSGGGISNSSATVNLKDTLVANNTANGNASDLNGAFNSQDYNLIGNTSGASFTGTTTHNITGVNPLLGPLQSNGGPTLTHALLPGSPAIDAGNSVLTTDQRGQPRPLDDPLVANAAGGNASDIGAYESHNLQVNSLADTDDGACTDVGTGNGCTLREAINAANAQTGTELITFAPALTSGGSAMITLLTALPNLSSDMMIAGPGANLLTTQRSTVGGTPEFRIFTINSGKTVSISGLTISNGNVTTNGDAGGGVMNLGTLTLTNSNLYANSAYNGGAVTNSPGAILTINNCSIGGPSPGQPNIASNGSGGGIQNLGNLTISNSSIFGNTAPNGGGAGISNEFHGVLFINGSTVSNNSATQSGGGILGIGQVTIINSTLSGNRTNLNGGGIETNGGGAPATLTVTNCTITNNRSDFDNDTFGSGGGIDSFQSTAILRNTIVAGNFRGTGSTRADIFGAVDTTSSFNLIGDGTQMTGISNGSGGNQVGSSGLPINAMLGALANNGGPTQTHALLSGSPAIDAGNNSAITNPPFSGPPFTDQRGGSFSRIADGDGNGTKIVDIGAYELQGILTIDTVTPPAGRTSGGQQISLHGAFANLSTVTMGGASASWFYMNIGDTSSITINTPPHPVGAVQIDLTPTSGSVYSKANAFAYLPTVFTDDTIMVGQTTAKAQHIIELRQAVDALRAVAGLGGAPWTDPALATGNTIKAIHILELRTYLDDAGTRLGYSTSPYTDPGLTLGFVIKRIHIEDLRQRIRTIAG